jgi:uncharacterized protein (TIGR02596 family)
MIGQNGAKRPRGGFVRGAERSPAFTLVELLVVISIMALMTALVVPAVTSMLDGANLAQGGTIVNDQIALARQIASARNSTVEVRLIKIPPAPGYRALQLWVSGSGSAQVPVGKVVSFPQSVAISQDGTVLSKMLASLIVSGTMTAGVTQNATYVSFSLRPSGEVVPVVTGSSARAGLYLTVVPARLASATSPPPNYATIQLNPDSGSVQLFRP